MGGWKDKTNADALHKKKNHKSRVQRFHERAMCNRHAVMWFEDDCDTKLVLTEQRKNKTKTGISRCPQISSLIVLMGNTAGAGGRRTSPRPQPDLDAVVCKFGFLDLKSSPGSLIPKEKIEGMIQTPPTLPHPTTQEHTPPRPKIVLPIHLCPFRRSSCPPDALGLKTTILMTIMGAARTHHSVMPAHLGASGDFVMALSCLTDKNKDRREMG